ncbi:protein Flattop isoform X2 [Electrophorus electricus]|uniref:protein Flattop isoform X2 n=1 Tax=Electrophorus electricus TaxID=8005 RepID=UPI0015CFBE63|nr:protein Flattop isoform X2 [Electrophorus electricus]
MSSSYSANQYESAFKSHRLLNWTVPKQFKERPSAAEGHTTFIASDRGHLFPKRGSSWPSFQGTWDLPSRIHPVKINPTARSLEGQERLRIWGQSQHLVRSKTGKLYKAQGNSRATSRAHHAEDNNAELQIPVSTPGLHGAEAEPERPLSHLSQAQSRPLSQQKQTQSRPASQQKQTGSRPASQQKQTESRPAMQQRQAESRPASQQNQAESRPLTQAS